MFAGIFYIDLWNSLCSIPTNNHSRRVISSRSRASLVNSLYPQIWQVILLEKGYLQNSSSGSALVFQNRSMSVFPTMADLREILLLGLSDVSRAFHLKASCWVLHYTTTLIPKMIGDQWPRTCDAGAWVQVVQSRINRDRFWFRFQNTCWGVGKLYSARLDGFL